VLESYAEKALSFANTFGLNPVKLNCKSESGKSVSLKLGDSPATKESKYQNLDSEEKDRLKQLVFILDKFCLSDSAYHELSMFFDDMPRKYTVIQCRDDLNSIFHIERLPGNMPGAMLNLILN